MKKLFVIFLILVLTGAFVFAGGGKDAGSGKVINITMANPSNPQDNCVKGFFHFKEVAEKNSNGRIAVDVKHSAQLGAQRDYMEQMQMGSLEMAEINVAVLSGFDSKFMVFDLPYVSKSVAHLQQLLDGGLAKTFRESLEASTGITITGWMIRSPRIMYIQTKPVHAVSDFAGLRIRIMESPVMRRTFELLGAVPVPLATNERYMALQTGVVDGAENSASFIIAQKEYEVTKFVSRTEHFISPNIVAMSLKFFKGLPADLQKVVLDAGDAAGRLATKLDSEGEADSLKELTRLGMTVNNITDKTPFIEKVRPIYGEYRDRIGGALIDAFTK